MRNLILAAALLLGACAGQTASEISRQSIRAACSSYTAALEQVVLAKEAGRLTKTQDDELMRIDAQYSPLCQTPATTPDSAASAVRFASSQLAALIGSK